MNTGIAEIDLVFALSLMLAFGFAMARLAKLVHLPAVTGYLIAGIILGPSGIEVITTEVLEDRLQVFMNMAIMLIAFSIGERCDISQLRPLARVLKRVSPAEMGFSFVFPTITVILGAYYLGLVDPANAWNQAIAVGLICGAVAIETSPPCTMAVIRECGATGTLSRLLTSSMVVNNVMTITMFGVAVAIAHVLVGDADGNALSMMSPPLIKIFGALAVGFAAGLICDIVVHRLQNRSDVLVVALATIFFCGGVAFQLGLSAILAGVAAGFVVVNRDRRDGRAFRVVSDFEPPLYALFFALAGVSIHLEELLTAGLLGIIYVVVRGGAKIGGATLGARAADLKRGWGEMLGMGLLAQAGLAIGLAVLVAQDAALAPIASLTVNLIITSVVINEMIGPPLTRWSLVRAGEARALMADETDSTSVASPEDQLIIDTVPWVWPKLQHSMGSGGTLLIGLRYPEKAPAMTRLSVLLAHHHDLTPLAVFVATAQNAEDFWASADDQDALALFRIADSEAANMGYSLMTEVEFSDEVETGLLRVAEKQDARMIILGQPTSHRPQHFSRIVSNLASRASCPVVVAKLVGPLHTERILVPIAMEAEYRIVNPIVRALSEVGDHTITYLRLMPPESDPSELREAEHEIACWPGHEDLSGEIVCKATAAEARVHDIAQEAEDHDIIVMASSGHSGLRRVLFGSLADDVAEVTTRSMLVVAGAMEADETEFEDYEPI
ncbi:MAG: cation:proton antiporter [Armatimonadota bacterium]|jgi:Kef-type K+ transport system membrane component KefB